MTRFNPLLRSLSILAAAAALLCPTASIAATATGALTVTATVSQNCLINSPTLAFGAYDPIVTNAATPLNVSGTATFTCTEGASAVFVTAGLGSNNTHAVGTTRAMAGSGATFLSYELYTDSGHTIVWNAVNSGGHTFAPTFAASQTATATIFGQVPAGQNVLVSSYTDSVTMTINF
jgi:spore coat protein U-like protein